MSVQSGLWGNGSNATGNGDGVQNLRAGLHREMRYLLTISTESGGVGRLSPSGLAHSFGVCLTEDWIMARGKGGQKPQTEAAAMPRFIDIRLSADQRAGFTAWERRGGDLITFLQSMVDDGYRVGVAWNGKQSAYTASITCKEPGCVNEGLCMTSFAGTLSTALWLVLYKHLEVTQENWLSNQAGESEEFG